MNDRTMKVLTRRVFAKLKTSRTEATCDGSSFLLPGAVPASPVLPFAVFSSAADEDDCRETDVAPPPPTPLSPPPRPALSASTGVPLSTPFSGIITQDKIRGKEGSIQECFKGGRFDCCSCRNLHSWCQQEHP
jgi:hypothetical protein